MKAITPNTIIGIATLALAVSFPTHAAAEQAPEPVAAGSSVAVQSIKIAFVKDDLATEQGREDLYRQIRLAAKKVCGPTGLREAGSGAVLSRNRQCYDDAMSAALAQAGSGQLAAMID